MKTKYLFPIFIIIMLLNLNLFAKNKKALFVIAPENFREEELFDTKKVLEEAKISVTVASKTGGTCTGMGIPDYPNKFENTVKLKNIKIEHYDAIVFIGGAGAKIYWEDKDVHFILKHAKKKGLVVAAICIAPVTLFNAGVLGDFATVWAGVKDKLGKIYKDRSLVIDGKIITASGPESSKSFGKAIADALNGDKK